MEKINFEQIYTLNIAQGMDILDKDQISERANLTLDQFWINLKLLPF